MFKGRFGCLELLVLYVWKVGSKCIFQRYRLLDFWKSVGALRVKISRESFSTLYILWTLLNFTFFTVRYKVLTNKYTWDNICQFLVLFFHIKVTIIYSLHRSRMRFYTILRPFSKILVYRVIFRYSIYIRKCFLIPFIIPKFKEIVK